MRARLTFDPLTASPAADIGHLISNHFKENVHQCRCAPSMANLGLTRLTCWACCPSSLLRSTSERSASTSVLRASSWYRDTAERREEPTAASVSRRTGQDSLSLPGLCPLPASRTALAGPMRPPEGSRWQHDHSGFFTQTVLGFGLFSFPLGLR